MYKSEVYITKHSSRPRNHSSCILDTSGSSASRGCGQAEEEPASVGMSASGVVGRLQGRPDRYLLPEPAAYACVTQCAMANWLSDRRAMGGPHDRMFDLGGSPVPHTTDRRAHVNASLMTPMRPSPGAVVPQNMGNRYQEVIRSWLYVTCHTLKASSTTLPMPSLPS